MSSVGTEAVTRIAGQSSDIYAADGARAKSRVVKSAIQYANIYNVSGSTRALARAHDAVTLELS